jgi:hypothetical protein
MTDEGAGAAARFARTARRGAAGFFRVVLAFGLRLPDFLIPQPSSLIPWHQ